MFLTCKLWQDLACRGGGNANSRALLSIWRHQRKTTFFSDLIIGNKYFESRGLIINESLGCSYFMLLRLSLNVHHLLND